MKTEILLRWFFLGQLMLVSITQAQWVQTNLNADVGHALYSDGTIIYAATALGVYYTSDIGDPWFSIGPANEDIYCIIKTGNKIIAGSGTSHGVFLTTDNGQNWYQPPTLTNQTVYALAKNSSYVFAGTWGGGIFRSGDNGESWESAGLAGKGFKALLAVGDTLFAASPESNSIVYFTGDNGNTWDYGSLGYPTGDLRCLFYNEGKLFACDMGLWVSIDMGSTWHIQYGLEFDSTGYPINVKLFRSITKYNQYLIGSVFTESIYFSSDNGVSWTPFNEGTISDWTFEDLGINGSYLWALRDFFGNAYRRPVQELLTGLEEKLNHISDFRLGQNYPNPFNPTTTITFELPNSSDVSLVIYNLTGRLIKILTSSRYPAGSHQIQWDGRDTQGNMVASGIYVYRMNAGTYSQSHKMMLLK